MFAQLVTEIRPGMHKESLYFYININLLSYALLNFVFTINFRLIHFSDFHLQTLLTVLSLFFTTPALAQVFIPMGMWGQKTFNVLISDSPAYSFPTVSAGATVERTFTITNLGSYPASRMTASTFSSPNFNYKGGTFPGTGGNCTSTLPAASSCAVVITATSAMGGVYNDQFTLSYLASVPVSTSVNLSFTSIANTSPTITAIANRNIYEANYPFIPFQIYDLESTILCSGANIASLSSDNSVVPPANITYTGIVPFCYLNIIPVAGSTGSSVITLTVHDFGYPDLTATTSFTVTAIPLVSMTVLPETSIVPRNSTFQYQAIASYSDASTLDISQSASWTVTGAGTYTVNSFTNGLLNLGNVTGYPGVNINATYMALSDAASATFNASTITSIFVTPSSASINVSGTVQIKCYGRTADGGSLDLTSACNWSVPDVNTVQVNNYSPKGLVTGVSLGGPITVSATYASFSASAAVRVVSGTPAVDEVGTGLFARYFTGMSFNTFNRSRVDANIAFAWGAGNNPVGGADAFTVLWTGEILAPETGNYVFYTNSDDGIYLWVDGITREAFWTDHGPTNEATANIALTAGTKYRIAMAFYENGGGSEVHLKWKVPSSACASYAACPYVPQANLFPTSGQGMPFTVIGVGDTAPAQNDTTNNGLVRYYAMNGTIGGITNGATVSATTGANASAVNTNGTGLSYTEGLIDQAISFDGVDDSLTSANTTLSIGTNDRAFSFWINPTNVGAEQGLFFHGTNTNTTGFGATLLTNGTLRVVGGGTQVCDSPAGVINFGNWNHVVISYDGGAVDIVYITVNGATTNCTGRNWNTAGGNLLIGSSLTVAQTFSGKMDEFAAWNVVTGTNTAAVNFLPTIIYLLQNPKPAYVP